jgi:hypothetical protein
MDTSDVYPDVLGDALSFSSQRAAQLGSLVTAGATVEAQRRARATAARAARDERALSALRDQERGAWQRARAGWAPAHDSRWLAQADLLQAAGSGAPLRHMPMPTRQPQLPSGSARSGCVRCTPTPWHGTTGSAATAPERSTRCVRHCRCSPMHRTHVREILPPSAVPWRFLPRRGTVMRPPAADSRVLATAWTWRSNSAAIAQRRSWRPRAFHAPLPTRL